jgi:hypothetical protein
MQLAVIIPLFNEAATVEALLHRVTAAPSAITAISNNSPPSLMVTMTPFGYMAPRSKGMCILQRYIEFLH